MVRAGLAALLLALAARASAAAPLCSVEVAVEPSDAWVGQQLLYRLRILRRADVTSLRFADELAFPSFRVEWLPGQTLDPGIRGVGDHALVVEERRALFPVRAGTLAIPAARIECQGERERSEIEVPPSSVAVRELPPGAPSVVGPVAIGARLARERIALGDSVALTVTLRGEANLWDAAPPLGALDGIDVHPHAPVLEREPGQRLALARSFTYDLVPRRTGALEIPALRVAWTDPATGRGEVAETSALRFEVVQAGSDDAKPAAPAMPREASHARSRGRAPLWIGGLALFAATAGWLARRRPRRVDPLGAAAPHLDLARAAAARGDRDAERSALAAALRDALAARWPETRASAAEEMLARASGAARDAALALAELDRARFAPDGGGATRLDAERVRALVRSL